MSWQTLKNNQEYWLHTQTFELIPIKLQKNFFSNTRLTNTYIFTPFTPMIPFHAEMQHRGHPEIDISIDTRRPQTVADFDVYFRRVTNWSSARGVSVSKCGTPQETNSPDTWHETDLNFDVDFAPPWVRVIKHISCISRVHYFVSSIPTKSTTVPTLKKWLSFPTQH